MIQENQQKRSDLSQFVQAIEAVNSLLASEPTLQSWWDTRSSKLNHQLLQRLSQEATARKQFFLRLASFLLKPDQRGIEHKLSEGLSAYSAELDERVRTETADLAGQMRLRSSGKEIDVVDEQIRDLDQMLDDLRNVRYAWEDAKSSPSLTGTWVSPFETQIQQLEAHKTSIQATLGDLTRLKQVVISINNQLATAYRDNNQALWDDFNDKLTGLRSHAKDSQDFWVPPALKTHVSYNWINNARAALSKRRAELQHKADEIDRYVRLQHMEGNESLDQWFTSGSDEDRVWSYISSQRDSGKKPLIQQKSVLEQAKIDLQHIRDHATIANYQSYTSGVADALINGLSNRLTENQVLQKPLQDYLDDQITKINSFRSGLLPIVGGNLDSGESSPRLGVYPQVYEGARREVQSANFGQARDVCTQGKQRLATAIAALVSLKAQQNRSSLSGMGQRLYDKTTAEIKRLEAEQQNIGDLEVQIGILEGRYKGSKEKFESNLNEYHNIKHANRITRHRRRQELVVFLGLARQAFCECKQLCPQSELVRVWEPSFADTLTDCKDLSETDWEKRYFTGMPSPERAGAS